MHAKWFQLCPTPCNPVDRSPPDCSDQARILEWVAFPSPGYLPNPGIKSGSPTLQADSLPSEPPGKPKTKIVNELIISAHYHYQFVFLFLFFIQDILRE